MPRILHIIPTLERHGSQKQLLLLAAGLAQYGFEVHVCALARGGAMQAEFQDASIPTTIVGKRLRFDPVALTRLKRHIGRLQPDLVHAWGGDANTYGRIAASAAGVEDVVVGEYHLDRWKGALEWFVDRRLAPRTVRIVANCPAVREHCVENGLPQEKFSVIAPAIGPARPSDVSRAELLAELDCPPNARLIGVVGSLLPQRRVKDLIWAADLLRVLHDNLRLLVIGDGPQRPQLQRFARLASDLDHIRFLGRREDVWRIVPHLDAFWHGSANDGPSTAVMEALAAGVPVVASDIPANRELILHGQSGFIVPIAGRAARARATDQIFNEPSLVDSIGTAAKNRMHEHFRVEHAVRRHAKLYRELVG